MQIVHACMDWQRTVPVMAAVVEPACGVQAHRPLMQSPWHVPACMRLASQGLRT
jgi:hypothetical protein